jgi:hypothetical protein
MKRIIANVSSLMAVVVLFVAAGFAQSRTIKADVPFEFSVGQNTYPAGQYWIMQIAPHILALRDGNNAFVALAMTQPMSSLSTFNPKLRFEIKDGRTALSEVWSDGATGYKLPVSKKHFGLAQNQPAGVQATTSSYAGK